MNANSSFDIHNYTGDDAVARPQKSFHYFSALPVEIQIMIWRQFYLEPRHFVAVFTSKHAMERDEHTYSEDIGSFSYPYTAEYSYWTLRPAEGLPGYYNLIDTTINSLSCKIALSIRNRHWFPIWSSNEMDTNLSTPHHRYESHMPLPPAMRSQTPKDVRINWHTDYVLIDRFSTRTSYSFEYFPEFSHGWWRNIRNLVLDTDTCSFKLRNHVTEDNWWLFKHRAIFGGLTALKRMASSSMPHVQSEWAHFQTRYLLREALCTPPHWRTMKYEMVPTNFWHPPENMPRIPPWPVFLQKLQGPEAVTFSGIRVGFKKGTLNDKNEVIGAQKLFGWAKGPRSKPDIFWRSPDSYERGFGPGNPAAN